MPLLSVLAPVYNWDVARLLDALAREIRTRGLESEVEVVLVDDASPDADLLARNRSSVAAIGASWLRLIELPRNLGRSGARNQLMAAATGGHFLFLDADVMPERDDFLAGYLAYCREGAAVVCGGLSYAFCPNPEPDVAFYVFYGKRASVAPAAVRNECPWRWVFTSNIMVRRDVALSSPFEARFDGYGYEDIEWGLRMQRTHGVVHVDNPVHHLGLLTKPVLRDKMRQAARNHLVFETLHPDEAGRMTVSVLARRSAVLPASLLKILADLAGRAFLACGVSHLLALYFFQAEKVLRIALARKERGG